MKDLFFVSCTMGNKEDTVLYRSLLKLGTDRYRFYEQNRTGLSTIYNQILNERAGRDEVVVFVHDDVTIGDLFIQEKLTAAVGPLGYAIVGLAGTSSFNLMLDKPVTMWLQPPQQALSGAVEHAAGEHANHWSAYGPTPRRCVVMDGLFLGVDMLKIGGVRFDEQFEFHFYDLDFCLTAHRAGLALGTQNIYVNHQSGGSYNSAAFAATQEKFRAKWRAILNVS
ncbi:MAG: hypothetical protein JNM18_10295 [Planctomycetaceae bacterium]|nr:hypothetical protein [Planctomycetaceae bacterium]